MELEKQELCDEPCSGSHDGLGPIREKLLDETAAAQMANLFKALSDPTRVRLIHALLQKELCVHDLAAVLEMGQSAISHQLRLLRNLRIVKRRKSGKTVYYSLDDTHMEEVFVQTLAHLKHE
ncbi:ArsR/SmtB family transcription factor [Paenibacillus thermoaerophilus]|uniref:ArsR/SmtB family transcription factor n=1 Tax=Paenibacillus thermoaerophilus TaxID=1215385 RepID=A0ABW2V0W5_9BACL|nr:metalloregulator ArsR/SmtB family transcription factor [Paenibacillus thermoaerophilus]TMV16086.1 winged helix-turn-helix transcriptional regulator [Paenibacillus thermoaerophilus]